MLPSSSAKMEGLRRLTLQVGVLWDPARTGPRFQACFVQ